MDILLYGVNTGLVQAWRERLAFFPELQGLCSIMYGDIRQTKADAVVSPANSFGFMDGGIDGLYSQFFGWGVQALLQEKIQAMPMRELPVGCALCRTYGTSFDPVARISSDYAPALCFDRRYSGLSRIKGRSNRRKGTWDKNAGIPRHGNRNGAPPVYICGGCNA